MSDYHPLINHADETVLVIIDVQEKLAAAMPSGVRDRVIERIEMLLTTATTLSIPVIVTEQYPNGLGHTEQDIQQLLPPETEVIEKTAFSAANVEAFQQSLSALNRKQVVLVGMETHICVLQTALTLLQQDYGVFVVEDAVSSRSKANQYNALQRVRHAGGVVTNVESVIFELLQDASREEFKALAKLIV